MTQKGSKVRATYEWQGQGYKRNCCESCPAKQLKFIILSWEERDRKQARSLSCPAYYAGQAHAVICTVYHNLV